MDIRDTDHIKKLVKDLYVDLYHKKELDNNKYSALKNNIYYGFIYEVMMKPNFFDRQGREPKINIIMKYLRLAEDFNNKVITSLQFQDKVQQIIQEDLKDILEN